MGSVYVGVQNGARRQSEVQRALYGSSMHSNHSKFTTGELSVKCPSSLHAILVKPWPLEMQDVRRDASKMFS